MTATAPVRILGIDPGSRTTGWGIIEYSGLRSRHVAHGCLRLGDGELAPRLLAILRGRGEIVGEYAPHEAAIEETFVNRANAQSALVLGQARGAAICAVAHAGLGVAEYAAAQIKVAIAGNGRAEKAQIQHMVRVLLTLQTPKLTADASDALAVALTHAHVRGTRLKAGIALSRSWG